MSSEDPPGRVVAIGSRCLLEVRRAARALVHVSILHRLWHRLWVDDRPEVEQMSPSRIHLNKPYFTVQAQELAGSRMADAGHVPRPNQRPSQRSTDVDLDDTKDRIAHPLGFGTGSPLPNVVDRAQTSVSVQYKLTWQTWLIK